MARLSVLFRLNPELSENPWQRPESKSEHTLYNMYDAIAVSWSYIRYFWRYNMIPVANFQKSEFCMFDRLRAIFGPKGVLKEKNFPQNNFFGVKLTSKHFFS